jgi:ribosomal protein RSM22 (predicted rRNA methylase)
MIFQSKIEEELQKYPLKELQEAYESMSNLYRLNRDDIHKSLNSPQKRLAYLAARMPATYSAVHKVLQELLEYDECHSILDVGAGCGTASFAACDVLQSLDKVTAIEQNNEMIKLGSRLMHDHMVLKNTTWLNGDMCHMTNIPSADIVVMSYSLNEIQENLIASLLQKYWNAANKYLVIIEPGTQKSFNLIHSVRSLFLSESATLLAPCSHASNCQAFLENDLCHFSARVQRTSYHKYLKKADRGFEDEKFSYLIFSKVPKKEFQGRVVRRPNTRSGFVSLKICEENGIVEKVFTKKDRAIFDKYKKLDIGDKFF